MFNALTSNCTTNVMPHLAEAGIREDHAWDWRILLNGYADRLAYDQGWLAGGLPFDELKQRAWINPAARQANAAPDFSRLIRLARPGFH